MLERWIGASDGWPAGWARWGWDGPGAIGLAKPGPNMVFRSSFAYLLVSKYFCPENHIMKRSWYENRGLKPDDEKDARGAGWKRARDEDRKRTRVEDRKRTRDEIILLADGLIRRRGFNAFSYADIAGTMEIRNAAIHYYFPTKSELGQAVIEKEMERIRQYRWRTAGGQGDEQLRFLVSVFYRNSQLNNICLLGSLLPDFATFEPDMQGSVNRMCETILEWMTGSLDKARVEGTVRFAGEASDRAALVVSTLLSSLLLARASGQALFRQMVDRLLEDLSTGWRIGDLPEVEWPFPESPSFT